MLSDEVFLMRHLFYISYECNLQYKMSRIYKSAIFYFAEKNIRLNCRCIFTHFYTNNNICDRLVSLVDFKYLRVIRRSKCFGGLIM